MPLQLRKCIFDLALTIPAFLAISPVLAAIAVLLRIRMGMPVFFRQVRPGLNGKPFVIYKFRTMTDKRDGDGNLFHDAERLTPFGRFLRSNDGGRWYIMKLCQIFAYNFSIL